MKQRKQTNKKGQVKKEDKNRIKPLSKTKKIEGFTKAELKDICYEKLKSHFFIDIIKRNTEKTEGQVIIELSSSSSTSISEENISIVLSEKEDLKEKEEEKDENKLSMPISE